ncbi:MAG: hypothetical protein IGS23_19495 [Rivularia sp. T60_A2020_040]|nr:hypothetical protein [Rivularia sp. T60_A2020_040]
MFSLNSRDRYSKFNGESFELAKGDYQHVTTLSEWSLDSVSKMINSIQGAIFGKSSTPKGSTTISDEKSKTPDVSVAIQAMSDLQLLIAQTAFQSIQGILESFTSSTKTELMSNRKVIPLSPGLTLFMCIIENNIEQTKFFKSDLICQNFYLYTARYSIAEGKNIINFNQLQALADLQAGYDVQEKKIAKLISNLDPASDKWDEQKIKYDKMIENIESSREKIKGKIDVLKSN